MCHCNLKGSRSTSRACQLTDRKEGDVVRHTAQAGKKPVAAAEEASSATTGRVWVAFMIMVEGVGFGMAKIDGRVEDVGSFWK